MGFRELPSLCPQMHPCFLPDSFERCVTECRLGPLAGRSSRCHCNITSGDQTPHRGFGQPKLESTGPSTKRHKIGSRSNDCFKTLANILLSKKSFSLHTLCIKLCRVKTVLSNCRCLRRSGKPFQPICCIGLRELNGDSGHLGHQHSLSRTQRPRHCIRQPNQRRDKSHATGLVGCFVVLRHIHGGGLGVENMNMAQSLERIASRVPLQSLRLNADSDVDFCRARVNSFCVYVAVYAVLSARAARLLENSREPGLACTVWSVNNGEVSESERQPRIILYRIDATDVGQLSEL